MTHLTAGDLAWAVAVLAAIAVFWLPLIIAAARQVDRIGLVVLLTLLGLATGVLWFGALWAAFILPRRANFPAWAASPAPGRAVSRNGGSGPQSGADPGWD
jgi:hypothetical protein